ncbi:MAG: hypothetical protein ACUVXF_12640, partial [Desulfobaccales bacterium]
MRIIGISGAGGNFLYKWPTVEENFDHYLDYRAIAEDGEHEVRLGFCIRFVRRIRFSWTRDWGIISG